jgi:hypothetical protein
VIIYKNGKLENNIPNFDKLNYLKSMSKNNLTKCLMKLEVIPKEEIDSDEVL